MRLDYIGPETEENIQGDAIEGVERDSAGAELTDGTKKKLSKKKMIMIVVVILLIIGSGVGAFFFLQHKKSVEEAAKADSEKKQQVPVQVFYDMDEMIVNLNTDGKNPSFMKLKVTLEVDNENDKQVLVQLAPRIRDVFQVYLRELRPSDMQGSVGLYRLKEELLYRINKLVYPAKIKDILFKDVLVQ